MLVKTTNKEISQFVLSHNSFYDKNNTIKQRKLRNVCIYTVWEEKNPQVGHKICK